MKAIWKFPLRFGTGGCKVDMPPKAKILTLQLQGSVITLWAEVDPKAEYVQKRHFVLFGTGWEEIEDGDVYIATVQQGDFVWHIYERSAR